MNDNIKSKLENLIKTFNHLNTKPSKPDEKISSSLRSLIESFKTKDDSSIKDLILTILNFDLSFYKIYGDEIFECLWQLYNKEEFFIEGSVTYINYLTSSSVIDKEKLISELLIQFLQFNKQRLNNLIDKNVLSIEKNENSEMQSCKHTEKNNNQQNEISPSYLYSIKFLSKETLLNYCNTHSLSRNDLLDIIMLLVYFNSDFQQSYTSLSTFLVSTQSSSVLLFKTLSLFSISLLNANKKDNYINSLLFVIMCSLREQAKSYLKSKGKLNESISYIKCDKNHSSSDHNFSEPIIISSIECDYLEQNFFAVIINLITSIISDINFTYKWEDCLEIYYKYLDTENLDVEEQINPQIACGIYLMLFLSDIIFFFTANFTYFNKNSYNFNSSFILFEDFICISLGIFNKVLNNPIDLFSFSALKRRFIEIECQKTSYSIKDKFNHYGISLLFYYSIFEKRKPLILFNNLNEGKGNFIKNFIPLISSKEALVNIIIDIFYSFLHLERINKHVFIEEKDIVIYEFLIQQKDFIIKNSNLIKCKAKETFLFELLLSYNKAFEPIIDLLYSKDNHTLLQIISNIDSYEIICKLLTSIHASKVLAKALFAIDNKELISLFNKFIIKDFIKEDKFLISLIDILGITNMKNVFSYLKSNGINDLITSTKDKDISNQINLRKEKIIQLIDKINF